MCYSDLMNSQMFYNPYKSSHTDRCQFNYQIIKHYLTEFTFHHQSKDIVMVTEKKERHVPFNFIRQLISKIFKDIECVLHIYEPLKNAS